MSENSLNKESLGTKDKFYYQGKFFEVEQDFWDYVKDFSLRQTTEEDFNSLFDMVKKNVWLNLYIRKTELSNGELQCVLAETFAFVLNRIWKKDDNESNI